MKNPNEPHPKPFYTPIANEGTLAGSGVEGKLNDRYLLEPVGYGMKFASRFVGATLLQVDFDPGPVNAVAFAAHRPDGKRIVAILNKDEARTVTVNLPGAELLEVLTAPSLEAKQAQCFLMFYAHTPPDYGKVQSVRLADGSISIEDAARHKITLRASLPLGDQP